MIGYWSKLVSLVSSNLPTKLYFIAKSYFDDHRYSNSFKWFLEIRNILITFENFSFWDNINFPNRTWLLKSTKQKLTNLYINEWKNECDNNTS